MAGAWRRHAALWGAACCLASCAGNPPADLAAWARQHHWQPLQLQAGRFTLQALLRQPARATRLSIYIEGDGAPWAHTFRPPHDPTPRQPLVLQLAQQDPAPALAYLARPCQYLSPAALAGCPSAYWTERRFSGEVLAALDDALDQLKQRSGATQLRLIGYSGGGVLATLLAQRRDDVTALITIAAPLALDSWVASQGLSPLKGSLDPLQQVAHALPPAVHLAGERDRQVPAQIPARFVTIHGGRLERVAGFDHACCWVRDWPRLLRHMAGETSP